MRIVRLLLVLSLIPASGCSALIAKSGHDMSTLRTKDEVHALLGEPRETGISDSPEAETFEVFRSRRKLAEPTRGACNGLAFGFTFGVSELLLFPVEVIRLTKVAVFGQKIWVYYDPNGKVHHGKIASREHFAAPERRGRPIAEPVDPANQAMTAPPKRLAPFLLGDAKSRSSLSQFLAEP